MKNPRLLPSSSSQLVKSHCDSQRDSSDQFRGLHVSSMDISGSRGYDPPSCGVCQSARPVEGGTRGRNRKYISHHRKETPMHSRLAACVLLIAGCALLAIPAQPAAQGSKDHNPIVAFAPEQTSCALPLVSFNGTDSSASCTPPGRPCSPQHSTCCAGARCVFRGGSTRVGYQCAFGTASASASTASFREKLSENKLDHDDLTEVPLVSSSAAE